jgi:ribosomal protein S18 acetylase RimI-like enzyme
MAETTVRRAAPSDVGQIARTLARAFQDDPAMSWSIPDATRRARLGPRYFEALIEHVYLPHDEVYTTGDRMAAALWAPPGTWRSAVTDAGPFLSVVVRAYGRNLPRASGMWKLLEAKHTERAEPHYYLPFVGTDPTCQGRGYGTALLRHMLGRCDAEGVGAYLESTSPTNLALYDRIGFEVIEELNWPEGGPPFWTMWREPR